VDHLEHSRFSLTGFRKPQRNAICKLLILASQLKVIVWAARAESGKATKRCASIVHLQVLPILTPFGSLPRAAAMSKQNGFVPIRRGLWEHLRDGRMSPLASLAFIYICSQADTRTGLWKGSAGALVGELGLLPRTARDVLERLEHGDYIRRFLRPGERFCYPILVHKFPLTQGGTMANL
jgi:hypothetical protein